MTAGNVCLNHGGELLRPSLRETFYQKEGGFVVGTRPPGQWSGGWMSAVEVHLSNQGQGVGAIG